MIEKTGNDLVIIADNPQELAEGQVALIEQIKIKEGIAQQDLDSANALIEACEESNINSGHANRLRLRAESRLLYLGKVRSALEAGYAIVPNLTGNTIAIRVKRDKPAPNAQVSTGYKRDQPAALPQILPEGEGRYVDPNVLQEVHLLDDSAEKHKREWMTVATEFDDDIGLPVEFLKPTIVQKTGKCMMRKLFDEIAVVQNQWNPASGTKGDPMVVGRIIDRRNRKAMSFLVAWFIDTKDI